MSYVLKSIDGRYFVEIVNTQAVLSPFQSTAWRFTEKKEARKQLRALLTCSNAGEVAEMRPVLLGAISTIPARKAGERP